MTPAYAIKQIRKPRHIDLSAQKINQSILLIYGIVIARFSVKDQLEKI